MSDHTTRPMGVTVVAILAWIAGALDIVSGTILLLLWSHRASEFFGSRSVA